MRFLFKNQFAVNIGNVLQGKLTMKANK